MGYLPRKVRVGITIGDPSGIGPEITLKAVRNLSSLAEFVIIGDAYVLGSALKSIAQTRKILRRATLVDLKNVNRKRFSFGNLRLEFGRASVDYLNEALALIRQRKIDCLVTCPVSKEAVALSGLKGFRGHTEFIASRLRCRDFVMLLMNKKLKFGLLTRHVALRDVSKQLKKEYIVSTIGLLYASLKKMFLIQRPRIVVCGLNPHASDNGLLGNEENRIMKPALVIVRKKIGNVTGPLPADVAIARAYSNDYDCVVATYHDQALIPLKLTGLNTGVNLTLGLPLVRTSPLHGTAFDIAGSNRADASSLQEAIKLAVQCTRNLKNA